jgi:signal transduction histidine kinase
MTLVDPGPQATWFRRGLSAIGIVAIGWDIIRPFVRGELTAWAFVAIVAALVAWGVFAIVPLRWSTLITVCLAIMVVGGGLGSADSQGVAVVPIIVAVVWLSRDPRRSVGYSLGAGLIGIVFIIGGDILRPLPTLAVVSLTAGVVVAFFGGLSRRQFTVAELRSRALVGEQARADLLASRQQIAHDIHDVLAHSLGGLVIQLDAVEALLEAGDIQAAEARVRDARLLAADGLGEARRAVAALSEVPDTGEVDASELVESLAPLIAAHRSLGGSVDFDESGSRIPVSAPLAAALRRALQEGLTNARKHAPGEPVTVRLAWKSGTVTLRITNPVGAQAAAPGPLVPAPVIPGGGHGLVGMRERFAQLPGGSATARADAGSFVVLVEGATS